MGTIRQEIADTRIDGAEGVKQQPVSVPWRVGQRRRGVILGAGKYGGKPQEFTVLKGCCDYVRTDDGEEWAFEQSWPNELIAEAPEPAKCGKTWTGIDGGQIYCEREIGHAGFCYRLGSVKQQPPPATEQTTPQAPEALPQRPEPAVGQVWESEFHGPGRCTITAVEGMRVSMHWDTGCYAGNPDMANDRTSVKFFADPGRRYVSGPVPGQVEEPCMRCEAPSVPGNAYCQQCCDYLDQALMTREPQVIPVSPKTAAPSPGAGAGTFSNVGGLRSTIKRLSEELKPPEDDTNFAFKYAHYYSYVPQPGFYGIGIAGMLESGSGQGQEGKVPNPPAIPAVCGLTTRSGIPCDLLPHQHKGRPCAVLPKTSIEEGLMKRREMSEADIEREARWPR